MKTLGALFVAIILAPISALVAAATMSKVWDWYVARSYGPGPSYAAWFGLGVILSLAVGPSLLNLQTRETSDTPIHDVIGRSIGLWIGCALLLGEAWLVGQVCGWI